MITDTNTIEYLLKYSNLFLEQVTSEYIYDLLYSAKEAHMNMIRVWGGMITVYLLVSMLHQISTNFF